MNLNLPSQFAAVGPFIAFAVLVLAVLVHVAFAVAVAGDGKRLKQQGKETVLVGFEI